MSIGRIIKSLRKDNDITQEKLAAYLNVSCQAISKWENETACPDLSLIVPIANFFDVTTDTLLERDTEKQKAEIEAFRKKASHLSQHGLVKEEIELWQKAVSKYPNNYECLTQFAYALFSAKHSDAFGGDEETADKYTQKTIEICERILEDCTENEWRDSATQMLVMIHGHPGRGHYDEEKAEKYAKQATSLYCCRELLLENAYRVNSEKHIEQKHTNALHYIDLLTRGIVLGKYKDAEEKIFALKTALDIYKLVFYDSNYLFFHCRIAQIYRYLAIEHAKLKDRSQVIENLKIAKKHANEYENIPDGIQHYSSMFLNKAVHDNTHTSKNFSGTETDLISDMLSDKVFDFMQESQEFTDFKSSLYL